MVIFVKYLTLKWRFKDESAFVLWLCTEVYAIEFQLLGVVLLWGRVSVASTPARWSSRVGSTEHPEFIGRHPG